MSINLSRKYLKALQCQFCSREFVSRKDLLGHELSHKKRTAFQCTQCVKTFNKEELFKKHLNAHKKEESYKHRCDICIKSFRTSRLLEQHHWSFHKDQKLYSCEICGVQFSWKKYFEKHLRTHDEKPFACKICHESFKDSASLDDHQQRHKITNSEKAIEKAIHIGKQNKLKLEECNSFSTSNSSNVSVNGDTYTQSNATDKNDANEPSYKPHVCCFCGDNFLYAFTLAAHMNGHTEQNKTNSIDSKKSDIKTAIPLPNDKPHSCSICGVSFRMNQSLSAHLKIHDQNEIHGIFYYKGIKVPKPVALNNSDHSVDNLSSNKDRIKSSSGGSNRNDSIVSNISTNSMKISNPLMNEESNAINKISAHIIPTVIRDNVHKSPNYNNICIQTADERLLGNHNSKSMNFSKNVIHTADSSPYTVTYSTKSCVPSIQSSVLVPNSCSIENTKINNFPENVNDFQDASVQLKQNPNEFHPSLINSSYNNYFHDNMLNMKNDLVPISSPNTYVNLAFNSNINLLSNSLINHENNLSCNYAPNTYIGMTMDQSIKPIHSIKINNVSNESMINLPNMHHYSSEDMNAASVCKQMDFSPSLITCETLVPFLSVNDAISNVKVTSSDYNCLNMNSVNDLLYSRNSSYFTQSNSQNTQVNHNSFNTYKADEHSGNVVVPSNFSTTNSVNYHPPYFCQFTDLMSHNSSVDVKNSHSVNDVLQNNSREFGCDDAKHDQSNINANTVECLNISTVNSSVENQNGFNSKILVSEKINDQNTYSVYPAIGDFIDSYKLSNVQLSENCDVQVNCSQKQAFDEDIPSQIHLHEQSGYKKMIDNDSQKKCSISPPNMDCNKENDNDYKLLNESLANELVNMLDSLKNRDESYNCDDFTQNEIKIEGAELAFIRNGDSDMINLNKDDTGQHFSNDMVSEKTMIFRINDKVNNLSDEPLCEKYSKVSIDNESIFSNVEKKKVKKLRKKSFVSLQKKRKAKSHMDFHSLNDVSIHNEKLELSKDDCCDKKREKKRNDPCLKGDFNVMYVSKKNPRPYNKLERKKAMEAVRNLKKKREHKEVHEYVVDESNWRRRSRVKRTNTTLMLEQASWLGISVDDNTNARNMRNRREENSLEENKSSKIESSSNCSVYTNSHSNCKNDKRNSLNKKITNDKSSKENVTLQKVNLVSQNDYTSSKEILPLMETPVGLTSNCLHSNAQSPISRLETETSLNNVHSQIEKINCKNNKFKRKSRNYSCKTCFKTFSQFSHLLFHKFYTHGCRKGNKYKKTLLPHELAMIRLIVRKMVRKYQKIDTSRNKKTYSCIECEKQFIHHGYLTLHEEGHENITRTYFCHHCNLTMFSWLECIDHQMKHRRGFL